MPYDQDSPFPKTLLTGVFIGFFDTIACLAYNLGYRDVTGYSPSSLINVSSLIFAVNLIFMIIGMIYFLFIRFFGRRDVVFEIFFFLVTAVLAWRTGLGHRFTDQLINREFKGLLLGIIVIMGIGALSIPFLYRSKYLGRYVV